MQLRSKSELNTNYVKHYHGNILENLIYWSKYVPFSTNTSKKYLITKMESNQRELPSNPRASANILSIIFFTWTWTLFEKGYKNILKLDDIFKPLLCDNSKKLGDRLETWVFALIKSFQKLLKRRIKKRFTIICDELNLLVFQIFFFTCEEKYAHISWLQASNKLEFYY